ncbi:tetratricopeptide repeat protein [Thermoactinomyces sp. DSM 45892]|uniref:tetratricopeptide repeat protein n=1 Tax=Thermoactinomyces sp. DSM 45892 TaxID=1882753 RepID=UPI0008984999|nr:tetratricopeptide repeat protein [Thermoactinomyces sp. DSM 45892]SDY25255.1 Tetratricopeptide repeat-containing protein [Thermoactinomyces sp. DSM 45892]
MNNQWDRIELGKFLAKARKAKRKRQNDLAIRGKLSVSTVCSYEKGKQTINEGHLSLILQQLDLTLEDVSRFRQSSFQPLENQTVDTTEEEEIRLRLISVENIISLVGANEGLKKLAELKISADDPIQVDLLYLRGKAYSKKKNWKKAHKNFFDAIQLINQKHPDKLESNLKTTCYHELSRIEHLQNNLHQAIKYSKDALKYFLSEGERQYLRKLVLISQVIFNQKLKNWEGAQLKLEEIASLPDERAEFYFPLSESNEINLNIFELNASVLAKINKRTLAIQYALKGIEMARLDKMYERSFELFTTLGSIYMESNKLNLAQICFETALKLEKHIQRKYLLAYIYTQLGMLYDKRKEIQLAEDAFKEAVKYSREIDDAYWETEALISLGKCYVEHGKYQQSASLLKKALSLAEQHAFTDQVERLNLLLGHCLDATDDPQFEKYALNFFRSNVKKSLRGVIGGEDEMNARKNNVGDPPEA